MADFAAHPPIVAGDTLTIAFTYQLHPKGTKQDKLTEETERALLAPGVLPEKFADALRAVANPEADTKAQKSVLRRHLDIHAAKNTYDYFIHKDLGGFLRRELDYFIKSEVLRLDTLLDQSDGDAGRATVRRELKLAGALKALALPVIEFLAQLEDFQKKLWLKKKFVTETQYGITLDRLFAALPPEAHPEFWIQVGANRAQRDAWEKLYAISEIVADTAGNPGYPPGPEDSKTLPVAFLRANDKLALETQHFPADFKATLLAALPDLDDQCDGLLIHSENFQALNLLQERYREQVKCIYIDPPYNTGSDGFAYKDTYQHSSWSSFLNDRLETSRHYATQDAALFASIDEAEQPALRHLLDETWGRTNFVADLIWAAGRKNDSRLVSVSHEYMLAYARNREHLTNTKVEWRQRKKGLDDIYAQHEKLKRQHGTDYKAMTAGLKAWYRGLADSHPAKDHSHYSQIDARGVYFPADISWPGGGGPKYEVLHPETKRPVGIPSRGWMFSDPARLQGLIDDGRVHFGSEVGSVPCIKSYLKDRELSAPYSVFYRDGRAATKRLRNILGTDDFGFPKDETVIAECVRMVAEKSSLILDYFAGSGTTGHAVIALNREDEAKEAGSGRRKYILVEMGEYFDTVLKPRIAKVVYAKDWKDGKPTARDTGVSHCFKVLRLESYEDTLNNLALRPTAEAQPELSFTAPAGRDTPVSVKSDYLLRYALPVESRGSPCLAGEGDFTDPWAYTLAVTRRGVTAPGPVDLVETYHYLLGVKVISLGAPETLTATFATAAGGRLEATGVTRAAAGRAHAHAAGTGEDAVRASAHPTDAFVCRIQAVETEDLKGRRHLILWRTLTGDAARDNAFLSAYFEKFGYKAKSDAFDAIHINGDTALANLLAGDAAPEAAPSLKIKRIETEFRRLMWGE